MAVDPAVVALIVNWARSNGFAPDLCVSACWGESELDVNASGDGGTSHGIIQGSDVHGKPRSYWIGMDGARRSLEFVQGRWAWALSQFPDAADRWRDDPAGFLAAWWPVAQGCDPGMAARRAPVAVAAGIPIYDDWVSRAEGCWRDRASGLLMPVNGTVGRRFGVVDEWAPQGHVGIDYPALTGADVRAVRAGIIRFSGWYNRYGQPLDDGTGLGQMVAIQDDRGVTWRYGHHSRLLCYVGQWIRAGETFALAGATGYTSGPHSHLERWQDGIVTDPAIDLLAITEPPPPPVPPPPPPPPEPPAPPTHELTDAELLQLLTARLAACKQRGAELQAERDTLTGVVTALHADRRALQDALTVEAAAHDSDAAELQDLLDKARIRAANARAMIHS